MLITLLSAQRLQQICCPKPIEKFRLLLNNNNFNVLIIIINYKLIIPDYNFFLIIF